MSTINDTDLFLVNRAGSSYKTTASNISSATDTDLFLVTRAGNSYKVAKSDVDDIADTDLLLCDRAGSSYKVSGADFKGLFTTRTCGTFTVTASSGSYAGHSSNPSSTFLYNSSCKQNYIRPNGGSFTISCTTSFEVSSGDTVSVRCSHDGSNSATIYLIMPGETNLAIGSPLGDTGSWYPCNDPANWKTVTLTTSGTITGLIVTGGRGSDAYGIGQLKVNGYIIYSGATYKSGIN